MPIASAVKAQETINIMVLPTQVHWSRANNTANSNKERGELALLSECAVEAMATNKYEMEKQLHPCRLPVRLRLSGWRRAGGRHHWTACSLRIRFTSSMACGF